MGEAWIIHAPMREDGLSQVDAAKLLDRHERVGGTRQLRVGLLSPTAARQMVRSPRGKQAEFLEVMRSPGLARN